MPLRTVKHKVSKRCWASASCKKQFIKQYEDEGEFFLNTRPIASNPTHLWAVFEVPD